MKEVELRRFNVTDMRAMKIVNVDIDGHLRMD